jgi:hypothetical protein
MARRRKLQGTEASNAERPPLQLEIPRAGSL